MRKYQYQLVRYIHDRLTGEFVNIGVVVFQPETRFLKSQFLGRFGRISQFFNDVNGYYLLTSLKNFEKQIDIISNRNSELFYNYGNINEITEAILPKDDSALECSEIFYGIDLNYDSALTDIFERFVNKYYPESETDTHDDKYVWKNVYKKYFDRLEITKKLKSHSVQTAHDIIQFDKAWKNGIWHCYQALSFDLKRVDTIKNKVYKWSGILNELDNSNEEIFIHFLTVGSTKHRQVQKFIDDTLCQRDSKSIRVSVTNEKEAEGFVDSVKKEMDIHN
jgi:hypothetical protein